MLQKTSLVTPKISLTLISCLAAKYLKTEAKSTRCYSISVSVTCKVSPNPLRTICILHEPISIFPLLSMVWTSHWTFLRIVSFTLGPSEFNTLSLTVIYHNSYSEGLFDLIKNNSHTYWAQNAQTTVSFALQYLMYKYNCAFTFT